MQRILTGAVTAFTLLISLAIPPRTTAQGHAQYRIIDLGTLGGPSAYKSVNAPGYQIINNTGVVGFGADTPMKDPNAPKLCYEPDCSVAHATRWQNGVLSDLGALPGAGDGSQSGAINASGWITGNSENGVIDPVSGCPELRAVLWTQSEIIDLGTFGGSLSLGITVNDSGEVVGFASNPIPDPFAFFVGFPRGPGLQNSKNCLGGLLGGTQVRAFLWQNGVLQDLGTLGGPDAQAFSINKFGQVAGLSFTDPNETVNATTGIPSIHSFLWDHGRMTDLGTLGGTYAGGGSCSFALTFCNSPFAEGSLLVNNLGQVIGTSNLAGDQIFHPFLWQHGTMTDLGTLGGNNGTAIWLTDTGEVVGEADLPTSPPGCFGQGCIHHAFLWNQGVMTDLGTLGTDPCSRALMMNSVGQIVGTTIAACGGSSTHPFLWENGGPMVDLNILIPANSGVTLYEADNINDLGQIVASGLPAGCKNRFECGHLYLLIPAK